MPILAERSPLVYIPDALEPRQKRCLQAIRYSLEFVETSFGRLNRALDELSRSRTNSRALHSAALLDAWSVVDSVYRVRTLIRKMPHYRERAPSKQIFLRQTRGVKELRNAWQHLGDEMDERIAQRLPVLGRLVWVSPLDISQERYVLGTYITGQAPEAGGATPVIEISDGDGGGLPEIALIAAEVCVSLTSVYRACSRLAQTLEQQLTRRFVDQPSTMNDTVAFMVVEVRDAPPSEGRADLVAGTPQ